MTLLWQRKQGDTHYEVKQAGHSLRLYSNGVFHSQWNPRVPVVGQLWESLFLPALFLKNEKPLKILVLGVGGGAVVNLFNHFLKIERIVGVELDPVHLQIAKRWFKSQQNNVDYDCEDATIWIKNYRGPKFDLIIEDLFMSDPKGEVLRAVPADQAWLRRLARHLKPEGVLAMNFESIRQASKCWSRYGADSSHASGFKHAGLFASVRNENAIAVFRRVDLNVREFKQSLYAHPELDNRKPSCKLDFKYRKLKSLAQ